MRRLSAAVAAVALLLGAAAPAGAFAHANSQAAFDQIDSAIREHRYVDAAALLDQLALSGEKDPRVLLLTGQLHMAEGRCQTALVAFSAVEATPLAPAALESKGVCLAMMNRTDEALPVLLKAVAANPAAWRAWNTLGATYDDRGRWAEADGAYDKAMAASGGDPLVLNNRGYSHLLRRQYAPAVQDFLAALRARPDFAAARTNLRLALAMQGEYDRALSGGRPDERAQLLNNAGFAAAMRGDYARAQELLGQAMAAKGEYYGRASENLKMVQALAGPAASSPARAAP